VPLSALDPVMPGTELAVDGGRFDAPLPEPIACVADPACDGAVRVEVGDGFACAVRRTSGRVSCWGDAASSGQLGDGTSTPSAGPVDATGIADVRDLAVGDAFACAVGESDLWCWGDGTRGQIGDGQGSSAAAPVVLSFSASRIFAAARTACAGSGETLCWGGPVARVPLTLADDCGGEPCAKRPSQQAELDAIDWISDEGHACVVRLGALACSGENTLGEVGDGTREPRTSPAAIEGLGVVWSVATTARSTCAIDADVPAGSEDAVSVVRCWGAADLGQNGGPMPSERCGDVPCSASPARVDAIDGALELAATGDTFCARTGSGSVYCWGSDATGALGDGVGAPDACTDASGGAVRCARRPTRVRGLDAIDLDARAGTFCAARRDGGVSCWGATHGSRPQAIPGLPH
jgi:serine/threonine-protein kinase